MSESDPTEPTWPQYSWPTPDAEPPTQAQAPAGPPGDAPTSESVSWPPTQPTPPAAGPYASSPYAGNPYAGNPYAGNPYAGSPYAGNPYAGPYGAGPAEWPPAPASATPPPPPSPTRAKRGLAALAALALVLASAGVGAGVAIAVHNPSNTRSFSADNTIPSGNGGTNGGTNGGNGFGGSGNGSVPSGSGSLNTSAIASKVNPALVNINTTLVNGRAAGTGMLVSSTGEILTNNHVIAGAKTIKVVVGGTGPSHDAKVLGYDVTEDVALIQITDKVSDLPTIVFGEPSKVQVGDPVVAIGNAGGAGGTPKASQGQVTALDQEVTAGDGGDNQETLEGMIQINAPIQPGDSGGALVDSNGRVIGMNTAAAGGGQFNAQGPSNVGFAIPIDNAVNIVSQIRTGNDTDKIHIGDRALLGVNADTLSGDEPVSSGTKVVGLADPSGAKDAGIQVGDVITKIDGSAITDPDTLQAALAKHHPGDTVSVDWVDASGNQHNANIKLIVGPPL